MTMIKTTPHKMQKVLGHEWHPKDIRFDHADILVIAMIKRYPQLAGDFFRWILQEEIIQDSTSRKMYFGESEDSPETESEQEAETFISQPATHLKCAEHRLEFETLGWYLIHMRKYHKFIPPKEELKELQKKAVRRTMSEEAKAKIGMATHLRFLRLKGEAEKKKEENRKVDKEEKIARIVRGEIDTSNVD